MNPEDDVMRVAPQEGYAETVAEQNHPHDAERNPMTASAILALQEAGARAQQNTPIQNAIREWERIVNNATMYGTGFVNAHTGENVEPRNVHVDERGAFVPTMNTNPYQRFDDEVTERPFFTPFGRGEVERMEERHATGNDVLRSLVTLMHKKLLLTSKEHQAIIDAIATDSYETMTYVIDRISEGDLDHE